MHPFNSAPEPSVPVAAPETGDAVSIDLAARADAWRAAQSRLANTHGALIEAEARLSAAQACARAEEPPQPDLTATLTLWDAADGRVEVPLTAACMDADQPPIVGLDPAWWQAKRAEWHYYRKACRTIARRHDVPGLEEARDRAMNAWVQANSDMLILPAFDIATLLAKLELFAGLREPCPDAAKLWLADLLADARLIAAAADPAGTGETGD